MTNYLRFPDEDTFKYASITAGLYKEPEGSYIQYTHEHAMDIVGTIYNNDAVLDPETFELITPATQMEGWYINYIGELPDGWDQYLVSPTAPYRVFA
jgi:hypothetical protein